jgi:hypothetical protein
VILVVIAISSALSSSGGGSMAPIFIGGGNGYRGSGSYSGGK